MLCRLCIASGSDREDSPVTKAMLLLAMVGFLISGCTTTPSYRLVVDMQGVDANAYERDLVECKANAAQVSPVSPRQLAQWSVRPSVHCWALRLVGETTWGCVLAWVPLKALVSAQHLAFRHSSIS